MSESIEYKGYIIEIKQDADPESPREWDNLGTMICFHRRYNLGDKHEYKDPDQFRNFVKQNKCVVLPLYLYDHSGISISTKSFCGRAQHAEWDSGQVGWIFIPYARICAEYSIKRVTKKWIEKIKEYLTNEVETYDQYLCGDVYGYNIEDVDSCCGFYGYDHEESGLLEYARNAIDCIVEQKRKEKQEQIKVWIKNKVPLNVRAELCEAS